MMVQDITERKMIEDNLRESEERYRALFENCLDAVLLTAPDGRILSANTAACRMFGRTEQEICQLGLSGIADITDPLLPVALTERSRTGKFRGELTFIRKDGTRFPGEISSAIFKDQDGHDRTSTIIRDVTERKQMEEVLRESKERYRTLFERTSNPILVIDTEGNYVSCNEGVLKFLECTRHELLEKNVRDFIPPGKERQVIEDHKALWDVGGTRETEYYVHGEVKNLELTITPAIWHGKRVVFGIGKDITKRKQLEKALQESEELYRVLTEKSIAGVYVVQDGKFQFLNNNAIVYTGYTIEELIGAKMTIVVHPEDWEQLKRCVKEMLRGERMSPYEFRIITKEGHIRWFMETATSIIWKRRRAVLGNCMDITERKAAEEKLQLSTERLRKVFSGTIQAISVAVETRDPYTAGHQKRVTDLARTIASEMGLPGETIDAIRRCCPYGEPDSRHREDRHPCGDTYQTLEIDTCGVRNY
ncbi:MAG: PAS domain S-box protein [Deltaproteobacteria bacterium]|nr:PAS domain S-box protein [Deltaproteobacteria bacterium]